MYHQLFTRLVLGGSVLSEVSQPVPMDGANAAQLDLVVFTMTGTSPSLSCQLQESNDLENWRDKGAASAHNAVGYAMPTAATAISSGYVRLRVTLTGTPPVCVLSAGVNTAAL